MPDHFLFLRFGVDVYIVFAGRAGACSGPLAHVD